MNNAYHFYDQYGKIPVEPVIRIESEMNGKAKTMANATNRRIIVKQNQKDRKTVITWEFIGTGELSKTWENRNNANSKPGSDED